MKKRLIDIINTLPKKGSSTDMSPFIIDDPYPVAMFSNSIMNSILPSRDEDFRRALQENNERIMRSELELKLQPFPLIIHKGNGSS